MPPSRPLPKEIQDKPFTWNEAKALGVSWNHIQLLLKNGVIERLSHNVYRASADDTSEEDLFRIATLRIGTSSAVCLLSALEYYDLTDAISRAVWLLVPAEKQTRFKGVRLFRKRNPQLEIGIVQKEGYQITSLERTLAECLAEHRRIGVKIAVQALRYAISKKKTTLSKVANAAIHLGVFEKIRPYLEALS